MIYRPIQQNIDDYFASPIISQSRLKLLPKGVDVFNEIRSDTESEIIFYEEKSYFILGAASELKIQQDSQIFNQTYHLSEVSKPGPQVLSIVQQLFDRHLRSKEPTEPFLLLNDELLLEDLKNCIEFHEFYPKWGMDAKLKKVHTEGTTYYNDLVSSSGKQILDITEATIVNDISDSWEQSRRTYMFFDNDYSQKNEVDYHYQFPIYFEYMNTEFKALLDILEVDHKNKTLRPLDLKTLGNLPIQFPSSLRKLRYDFQGTFYCLAVSWWKKNYQNGLFKDYKVLKPKFIVETTKIGKQGEPLVFECSDELMNISLFGRKLYSPSEYIDYTLSPSQMQIKDYVQTSEIYGINETIELYNWHLEYGFEVDKIVREMDVINKPLTLRWEGIVK